MTSATIPQPMVLLSQHQVCEQHGGLPCDACTLLADYDAKIVATSSKLDEHPATRCALLTQVNAKHDPMGYRLPVEVVSTIFQHCLPNPPSPETFKSFPWPKNSSSDQEFSQTTAELTSINHNWRNIAHSTPGLWNSIFLNFTRWSISEDRLAVLLNNVKQRIHRSGDLLLDIRFITREGPILVSYCAQILEALCLEAHRWRSLCLSAPRKVITVLATQTFPQGSPYLDYMVLNSHNRVLPDNWVLSFHPSARLFAPSYLSLRRIPITTTTFDFSRITSLNLGSTTNSKIVNFLDVLPRLTSLECQIRKEDQLFSSGPPVIHPSLKILHLTVLDVIPNLLSRLTLPSLETFICYFPSNEHDALHAFLLRSNCLLQTLSVDMQCGEQEFIELLHLTPGLYHLRVHSEITSHFFSYLGETARLNGDQKGFLPHLRTLIFSPDIFHEQEFSWSFLRSLVPASPAIGSKCRPLHRVTIFADGLHVKLIDRLDLLEFIVGGLEIIVNSEGDSEQRNQLEDEKSLADALGALRTRSLPI
ncbi:hypothetical protein CPB83DRAFT_864302 [Crepidotus variabilis]|uniref:F-box domain-containing protein n=1 Tax=Crepidotus variabilis TaxID=179855 RepID=A0A9P6JIQ7_9AGAR|nr:hypothetical protein CPB83DRAFT_864302 [Crepidotus variabilis]